MRRLLLTLPTPAENVALDEALLDWAEEEDPDWEFLRVWESPHPVVVVGRSSRIHNEVNEAACAERGIPILRRTSGGAAVVAGPGCLMYAVVLSYALRPELRDIRCAHTFVLGRLAATLRTDDLSVMHAGTSDLAIEQGAEITERGAIPCSPFPVPRATRKFSGNSLRAKRTHLVYHGTLLYNFDLSLIDRCLRMPPRQPDYRAARDHLDFVTNLPLPREAIVEAILAAWPTTKDVGAWPQARVAHLVTERFSRDGWNREFE